jgi:hypothetical protein
MRHYELLPMSMSVYHYQFPQAGLQFTAAWRHNVGLKLISHRTSIWQFKA